jgi:peptidoglycan/LPS O-acetylase OafA/YrhL
VLTLTVGTVGTPLRQFAPPWPQWEFGLAAIPLGVAVGRAWATPSRRTQVRLLCMICAMMLGTCTVLTFFHLSSLAVPYGLAIVLVCLACGWQVNGNGFVAAVAPLTFGIYLVHPLVMYGLSQFFRAEGYYAGFVTLTMCISGAVTWGLMKTPLKGVV